MAIIIAIEEPKIKIPAFHSYLGSAEQPKEIGKAVELCGALLQK